MRDPFFWHGKFCLSVGGGFHCRWTVVHVSIEPSYPYFMEQWRHFPDLKLKEMVHFSLWTEIRQENKWKASKCLSMQWEKYWNKIEFPRLRPVLVAPQIDIRLFKEIRTVARKSIFLFKSTDRNSDRCFDIFLKINGSLPDQVSLQLHTGRSFLNVEI